MLFSFVLSASRESVIPLVVSVTSTPRVTSTTLVLTASSWSTVETGPGSYWGPGTLTFESYVLAARSNLILMLGNTGTKTSWLKALLVSSQGELVTFLLGDSNRLTCVILTLELKRPTVSLQKVPSKELMVNHLSHEKDMPRVGISTKPRHT